MPAAITESILNALGPPKQSENWAPKVLAGAGIGLGAGGLAYGASKLSDIISDQMLEHKLNKMVKDTEERKTLLHDSLAGDIGNSPEQAAIGDNMLAKNDKNLNRTLFHDSNALLNKHSLALKNHSLLRKVLLAALPIAGGIAGYAYAKTGSDKMNTDIAFLTGFAKFAKDKGLTGEEADAFLKVASVAVDRAASDASMLMRGGMGAVGGSVTGMLLARIIGKMRGQNEIKTQLKDVPIGAGIGALAGAGLGAVSAKLGSVKENPKGWPEGGMSAAALEHLVKNEGKRKKTKWWHNVVHPYSKEEQEAAEKAVSKKTAGIAGAIGKAVGAARPAGNALVPKLKHALKPRPRPKLNPMGAGEAPHIPAPTRVHNLDAPGGVPAMPRGAAGHAPTPAGAPQSPLIPKNIFPQFAADEAAQTAKIRMPAPPNSSASPAVRQAPRPAAQIPPKRPAFSLPFAASL
jgi:hypothetical protein